MDETKNRWLLVVDRSVCDRATRVQRRERGPLGLERRVLGGDTERILSERLGLATGEIANLKAKGVVA